MLVYRIICALVMAWAVVWVLSEPEAAALLSAIPEMGALSLIGAAYVGGFNLAVRQGWGFVVALANGVWAGVLSLAASGVLYMVVETAREIASGEISGIGGFFDSFGDTVELLLAAVGDARLLMVLLAATSAAGVLTELIHWFMVRVRSRGPRSN